MILPCNLSAVLNNEIIFEKKCNSKKLNYFPTILDNLYRNLSGRDQKKASDQNLRECKSLCGQYTVLFSVRINDGHMSEIM